MVAGDLGIHDGFDPGALVGKKLQRGSVVFELGAILRAGPEAVVYEARDVRSSRAEHVLKVYRTNLSADELERRQADARLGAEIVGDGLLGGELFRAGAWAVRLSRRAFDAVSPIAPAARAGGEPVNPVEVFQEIAALSHARDYAKAARRCDAALAEYPAQALLLRARGIARLGMGELGAAGEDFAHCFQLDPSDTEHYVTVIQVSTDMGRTLWARRWVRLGAQRARDPRQVYLAWFDAEERAEHVKQMRACLAHLRLLEEPEPSLDTLRARVEALEERLTRCAREVEGAFRLVQDRKLEEALPMALRLLHEHPLHVPALILCGVLAMEQGRWIEAISVLRRAFVLQPLGDPRVPLLIGHAYRELDMADHQAVMRSVWQELRDDGGGAA